MNKESKELIKVETKEKKFHKFIEIIKKKWLINGSKTILLVAIIIGIFFAINIFMESLELTPIDFSQEQLFTLTQESKDKVRYIGENVKIYFIEYSEDDTVIDLAKQYGKVNPNIEVEVIKASERPDIAQKYEISTGTTGIIVECGEKFKVLSPSDLVTYDYSTYETISVAEEKLTSAITSVATTDIPKVYFLTGYSNLSLSNGLQYLDMYLQNEVNDVETVDILTTGKVPDDCDTLVIVMPSKDFDELATNSIIDYINRGGNILWFQAATAQKLDTPNINKVLDVYGIKPFDVGIIMETDADKMLSDMPDYILPDVQSTEVTQKLQNSEGLILLDATKINTAEDEVLTERKVEKTELLKTGDEAFFRTNFYVMSDEHQEGEEQASFTVGQMMTKTLADANEETGEQAKTSKLIIFGEAYFISDVPLSQNSQDPAIRYRQNKDVVLNSIAYLSNREEDIVARKSTGIVTYTATETENNIIVAIIFTVPCIIIVAGAVVWFIRRRKK